MAYKSALECTDTPWNPGKAREMTSKKLLKQVPAKTRRLIFFLHFAMRLTTHLLSRRPTSIMLSSFS
jgi:hypothetical protein